MIIVDRKVVKLEKLRMFDQIAAIAAVKHLEHANVLANLKKLIDDLNNDNLTKDGVISALTVFSDYVGHLNEADFRDKLLVSLLIRMGYLTYIPPEQTDPVPEPEIPEQPTPEPVALDPKPAKATVTQLFKRKED